MSCMGDTMKPKITCILPQLSSRPWTVILPGQQGVGHATWMEAIKAVREWYANGRRAG